MRRLGLTITGSRPGGVAAIGWCYVDDKATKTRVTKGERQVSSAGPAESALAMARSQGVARVTLTTYANLAAYHGSRGQRDGLSLDEHRVMIAEIATFLRTNGITVDFEEKA